MDTLPSNLPDGPDNSGESRGSIKCRRAIVEQFYSSAKAHGENASECLSRLINAAETLPAARLGSISKLTEQIEQLESAQGICAETLLELATSICSLNARLDDGGVLAEYLLRRPSVEEQQ